MGLCLAGYIHVTHHVGFACLRLIRINQRKGISMYCSHPKSMIRAVAVALLFLSGNHVRESVAAVSWADADVIDEAAIASPSGMEFSSAGTTVTSTYALIGGPAVHPSETSYITYEANQASSAGLPYVTMGFDTADSSLYEGISWTISFGDAQNDLFFDLMDLDLTGAEQDGIEVLVNGVNMNTMPLRVEIPGDSTVGASDQAAIDGWLGFGPGSIVNTVGTIAFDLRNLDVMQIEIRFLAGDDPVVAADPDGQRISMSQFGQSAVIPEPSSLVISALGLILVMRVRRR